ncbi:ABC transporter permease [Actinoplanes couchii]|uniref:Sugar ABC transporter permease n=1 Tax=Actinoplanes couchii TaxID=403638 RepID=A0ABQ3XRV3_9ACTN|nr:ABC transporter permease [Actinoplanes couchii]MDR6318471.1 erythritol transport system permease protein [Actinoplanes couchii]GID61228.1 sugar ABC transporter permease [Actinoplanes couchii]
MTNTDVAAPASTAAAPRPEEPRSTALKRAALLLVRGRTLVVLVILVIIFSSISSEYLTQSNLILMTKHVAINAILAIGVTFVILTGGIDLSVGSIAGLASMVAGGLLFNGLNFPGGTVFFSVAMVLLIGIVAGALVGAVNGLLITRLKVAPFIATLGMLYVARGAAQLHSDGGTYPDLAGTEARGNTGFGFIGADSVLGIPVAVWIMVVVAAAAIVVTTKTPFGKRIYAVGGNERAAVLSGIRVNRVKIAVYVISGACAALAGLLLTSELGAAYPDTATTYELNAIAAAVLGGTALAGGRGTIIGTVMGAFVIGFLSDGLVLVGVSTFWQSVVKGAVIIVAVITEQAQQRLQSDLTRRTA